MLRPGAGILKGALLFAGCQLLLLLHRAGITRPGRFASNWKKFALVCFGPGV